MSKENIQFDSSVSPLVASLRTSQLDYLVLGYSNVNTLTVLGSGLGASNALASAVAFFVPNEVRFALLRVEHLIDGYRNNRFVLLEYVDEDNVAPMKKSLVSAHKPQLRKLLAPVHITISGVELNDFQEDVVEAKLCAASGMVYKKVEKPKVQVDVEAVVPTVVSPVQQKPAPAAAPVEEGIPIRSIKSPKSVDPSKPHLENEEDFKIALLALQNQEEAVKYLIVSFVNVQTNTLKMIHTGSGSIGDFVNNFEKDKMNYGLLRVVDMVDNNKTIKFVLVTSQPESLMPTQKAKIGMQKQKISLMFRPYHIDLFTESLESDISEKSIMNKVQSASGSLVRC